MSEDGFNKLYWGFFFTMIDFRLQGVDIIPDIIGYILFAVGFSILASRSSYFKKAANLNIFMIGLSVFSIYEKPAQNGGIQLGQLGVVGIFIGIASMVLSLVCIYYLFMGIQDIANNQGKTNIALEANDRWVQYLILSLAMFAGFILIIIPALAVIYILVIFIATIILTFTIMGFMKRCGTSL